MNPSSELRQRATKLLIVGAVLSAGWIFGVRRLHADLETARAELAAAALELSDTQAQRTDDHSDVADTVEQLGTLEATLRAKSDRSAETLKIYEELGTAARRHKLRIDRVQPVRGTRDRQSGAIVQVSGAYSFDVLGTFADTAAFLHTLENEMGLTFVTALTCAPAAGTDPRNPTVQAHVETAHLRLAAAPAGAAPGAGAQ